MLSESYPEGYEKSSKRGSRIKSACQKDNLDCRAKMGQCWESGGKEGLKTQRLVWKVETGS